MKVCEVCFSISNGFFRHSRTSFGRILDWPEPSNDWPEDFRLDGHAMLFDRYVMLDSGKRGRTSGLVIFTVIVASRFYLSYLDDSLPSARSNRSVENEVWVLVHKTMISWSTVLGNELKTRRLHILLIESPKPLYRTGIGWISAIRLSKSGYPGSLRVWFLDTSPVESEDANRERNPRRFRLSIVNYASGARKLP